LAHYEGDQIVAGAVANRTDGAIGLSNVFAEGGDLSAAYSGAASAAQKRWGSARIVGYESGEALEAAGAAGFVPIGGLTVWLRPKSS
jgi:hypothetical protein